MGLLQPTANPALGAAGFSAPGGMPGMSASPLGAPMPDIPPPPQVASPPSGATAFSPPTGGGQSFAQSVPLSANSGPPPIPPMAEIPPPYQAAPRVYNYQPAPSYNVPWQGYNNRYSYQQPKQQQAAAQPQAPQAQQPQAASQQSQQPATQNQNQQQQAPQQNQQQPQQQQDSSQQGQPQQAGGSAWDDAAIRNLNRRLQNPSPESRADAAMDLYKQIEANPTLATDPKTKPYVDAFLQKILSDSSQLVHQGAFLPLELGHIKAPSPAVRGLLQKMSQGGEGGISLDAETATNILGNLNNPNFQGAPPPAGQKLDVTSPQGSTGQDQPKEKSDTGQKLDVKEDGSQPEQKKPPASTDPMLTSSSGEDAGSDSGSLVASGAKTSPKFGAAAQSSDNNVVPLQPSGASVGQRLNVREG